MEFLVSVIIPCYKQVQYLDECLQSVIDQTYQNWECIIINDGCNDNTEEVAKQWINKDSRFKYLYKENEGVSQARNAGIRIAKGEYILPLDADDKISTEYIEFAINTFIEDQSLKVVYCLAEKFGDEEGFWNLKEYSLKDLCIKNMIFCSGIYRKSDWERIGGYDVNMDLGLEDWEFWISLLKKGGSVKRLNLIGFYYRIKNISRNSEINLETERVLFEYICVKHADLFVSQLGSNIYLTRTLYEKEKEYNRNVKNKKFVLNLFLKTFLGFSFFR